jgi:hypothetical protein
VRRERLVICLLLPFLLSSVIGQIHQTPSSDPGFDAGIVSVLITAPQTGPGLGPKVDVDEGFDLAFSLRVGNLTITDLNLYVLVLDEGSETYVPLRDEWVIDAANASGDVLGGPATRDGLFRIQIPERGYYFFKVRANYTLEGRMDSAEAGDEFMGPRVRVVPGLSGRSYAVLLGMPLIPLAVGLSVRWTRRRETRRRRRPADPAWLEGLRKERNPEDG